MKVTADFVTKKNPHDDFESITFAMVKYSMKQIITKISKHGGLFDNS